MAPTKNSMERKGHHNNECVALRDGLEAEAHKGNLNALLEAKEKVDPPVAVVETQDAYAWQEGVMKRQVETNVIIKEVDESLSALAMIDHETDPMEFHRIRMGFGTKSILAPTAEDPNYVESSNTDHSLNTLYDIGAPQNVDELNRTIEVLALLRWSKDQASSLCITGTTLYGVLPTILSHRDPLVITLLLGGCLQPRPLVNEGSP